MVRGETRKAWSVVALSSALAACLLAALLWATAPAAEAAGRYKTVTRTFSKTAPITIDEVGPATPYASEISVGGLKKGKILDVNLTLKNLTHHFPDDVDAMVSHRGANRTVMSDVGWGAPDTRNVTLRLDDEAAGPMSAALPSGSYKPTDDDEGGSDAFPAPAPAESGSSALSGFDGSNPNGPWQLWVVDDFLDVGGEFEDGWSVTIKARVLR